MMTKHDIDELVDSLRRERDELRLQFYLFKAETRDEWIEMETKWKNFVHKADAVAESAESAANDVYLGIRLLGDEVADGYRQIRDSLKSG